VIGGGGTSIPSNGMLYSEPRCRVLARVGGFDAAIGRKTAFHVEEHAPWSAFRDFENPCGFVAFDVDPGVPGGITSIAATYYAVTGPFGRTTPIDRFTLARPRRDSGVSPLPGDLGQHHTRGHRGVQRFGRPGHRDGHHGVAVFPHQA
jgi:hypothetical protein